MGGLWQAFVFGFAGVRARTDSLLVDPHLMPEWKALEARVRFHGSRTVIRVTHTTLEIAASAPVDVVVGGARHHVGDRVVFERSGSDWMVKT
jgi:trehalose/maltose hydrolase-like predicted phosphorylase